MKNNNKNVTQAHRLFVDYLNGRYSGNKDILKKKIFQLADIPLGLSADQLHEWAEKLPIDHTPKSTTDDHIRATIANNMVAEMDIISDFA